MLATTHAEDNGVSLKSDLFLWPFKSLGKSKTTRKMSPIKLYRLKSPRCINETPHLLVRMQQYRLYRSYNRVCTSVSAMNIAGQILFARPLDIRAGSARGFAGL